MGNRRKSIDGQLGPFSINWLAKGGNDLPADIGHAYVERLDAGTGIQLFRAAHALEAAPSRMFPLLEVEARFDEPLFNAQIWLTGSGCHQEYWRGRNQPPAIIVARPGRDTFRWHEHYDATVLVEGGVHSEMRSAAISQSTLRGLLGEAEAAELINRLGLSGENRAVVRTMPPFVSRPLRDAAGSRFHGPALRLFGQAKVLEYLAGLYSFVTDHIPTEPQPRYANRICQLHDQLLAMEGRLPTLSELALEYGLSARTLNASFVAMYGQSIVAFITHHRLQQAHEALLETQVPIKSLATRLGYSHVNHFNRAFKLKFGYPPGTLRRGKAYDPS